MWMRRKVKIDGIGAFILRSAHTFFLLAVGLFLDILSAAASLDPMILIP